MSAALDRPPVAGSAVTACGVGGGGDVAQKFRRKHCLETRYPRFFGTFDANLDSNSIPNVNR
jgi:hypothetical protein